MWFPFQWKFGKELNARLNRAEERLEHFKLLTFKFDLKGHGG
jgi:hypothetical protein